MQSFVIRQAEVADLVSISELDKRAFEAELGQDAYPLAVFRQFFDLAPSLMVVATGLPGTLVGYACGGIGMDRTTAWVLAEAVEFGSRRQGVGRSLVVELLGRMRAGGAIRCRLTVAPQNTPAIGLYRKVGFGKVGEKGDYFGIDKSRLIFEADLIPAVRFR